MSRHAARRPGRFGFSPLYIEPLEDRLVLSGLHPAVHIGEYSSYGKHAAAAEHQANGSSYSGGNQEYGRPGKPAHAAYSDNYAQQPASDPAAGDNSQQADNATASPTAASVSDQEAAAQAAAAALLTTDRAEAGEPAAPAAPTSPPPAATAAPATVVVRAAGAALVTADGGRAADPLPATRAVPPATSVEVVAGLAAPAETDSDAGTMLEDSLEAAVTAEEQAAAAVPQLGGLVVGAMPVDVKALERGAEQFFARLEELGEEVPAMSVLGRLAPWLGAVAAATAGLELARYTMKRQVPRRPDPAVRLTPDNA